MFLVIFLIGLIFTFGVSFGIWNLMGRMKDNSTPLEKVFAIFTFLFLIVFIVGLFNHSTPYYEEIDPFVDPCYSPISYKNAILFIVLHILALLSMIKLYFKEFELPPLQISIFIVFLTIGILINSQFLYQISYHDTSNIHLWKHGDNASFYLALYPIVIVISSFLILLKLIFNKAKINSQFRYENKYLNDINRLLLKVNNLPLLSIVLCIPILLLILIILVLFGQDVDSFSNIYSETATWKLSEHLHPPTIDDRHGHYLCTVAACGDPKIVKPIAIGLRNNQPILINRQLQIANAYECMIEKISPTIHSVIRRNYDKYGFNLSKRINTKYLSNITYFLMKPFEWIFLISLYMFYINPEALIKKQYSC